MKFNRNTSVTFEVISLMSICFILLLSTTAQVYAVGFSWGDVDLNVDTTFSLGVSFRVEDRDWNLIGKSNQQPYYNDKDVYTYKDMAFKSDNYGSGIEPPGRWSQNGDDGNLNFDKGVISEVLKITTDLQARYLDYGFFARVSTFYDFFIMSESDDMRVDIIENDSAKEQVGADIALLDAFVFYNSYYGDIPFSFRLGQQVINWGESSYIPHGISESNPIDVGKLRAPGAELKEAYVPVPSFWTSVGITETLGFEAFYQLTFERFTMDAPGTYFSNNDFIGDGGNWVQSSFQMPDLTTPTVYGNHNQIGAHGNHVVERIEDNDASDSGQFGLKFNWFSPINNGTEFGFYFMNYHSRRPVISGYVHDGVPVEYILSAQNLTSSQVSTMAVATQIQSDLQLMTQIQNNIVLNNPNANAEEIKNLVTAEVTNQALAKVATMDDTTKLITSATALGTDIFYPGERYDLNSDFNPGGIKDGWIHGFVEYPENIKLLGLSFNTVLPNGLSVAGEYSYRMDEPIQIDDVEMIMALSQPLYNLLASAYFYPNGTKLGSEFFSQHPDVRDGSLPVPGEYIQGYQLFDISQAQVSFTQLFSDVLGASKMNCLAEVGYVYVHDLPEQDELRFDALGTVRSGNPYHAGIGYFDASYGMPGIYSPEGIETNSFASAFSWGYRLMLQLSYPNVFAGINVTPKFNFSHDVYGYTPSPIATFIRHRKSASLNINFLYQNKWSFDIGGRMYWGAGSANLMSDRDYVWFNIKYSI